MSDYRSFIQEGESLFVCWRASDVCWRPSVVWTLHCQSGQSVVDEVTCLALTVQSFSQLVNPLTKKWVVYLIKP